MTFSFQKSVLAALAQALEESFKSSAIPVCLSVGFVQAMTSFAFYFRSGGGGKESRRFSLKT